MNHLIYFFAGGYAFYAGMFLSILAAAFTLRPAPSPLYRAGNLLLLLAATLTAASAAPLPWWAYTAYGIAVFAVLVARHRQKDPETQSPKRTALILIVLAVSLCLWELTYTVRLPLPYQREGTLYVLGDSLSIGADSNEGNWPQRLGALAGMPVRNLGFGGATTATALSNARLVEDDAAIVIIEVGGNDLLGGRSPVEFEAGLRAILEAVAAPDRAVFVIGLPLPPTYNRYGLAQRRLSREYGACFIPRRVLAKVIFTDGTTIDGLHFTEAGHRQFAEALWRLR